LSALNEQTEEHKNIIMNNEFIQIRYPKLWYFYVVRAHMELNMVEGPTQLSHT